MAQDWDIKARSQACHVCETSFEDKQMYFSTLVFEDESYIRTDYCEKCWPGRAGSASPYSTWQGIFRVPPPEPEERLKKETAESLLRHLMEKQEFPSEVSAKSEASKRNVIYILAVMLERKRMLVERDVRTHDDGTMIRIYEHRKTGETFLIPDPQLRLDQLENVQQEVIDMLGGDAASARTTDNGQQTADQKPNVRHQNNQRRSV